MDGEANTAAEPRDRMPRNRQRERVLRTVREHGGVVDAVELAALMKMHVTTVRFHLDVLCDEGVIERTRISRGGVGRPRTGYRAVEERLDYRALAEILAMELGETVATRARRAQRAGQQWAARIAASTGDAEGKQQDSDANDELDRLGRGAVLATEVFSRVGFEPELAAESEPSASLSTESEQVLGRERIIRLNSCPVRDLARAHPEVGCGVHLGLLQGLLDRAAAADEGGDQGEAVTARLEPFVEPELCIARLATSARRVS